MFNRLPRACRTLPLPLALAVLILAAPQPTPAAEESDNAKKADEIEKLEIAGTYACRGGNPGGGNYTGKVVITKTGETYKIQWTIGSGEGHIGTGIREGNVLSVCFASPGGFGVVAYRIHKDKDGPRLTGRWAGFGEQKTRSETLTKRPLPTKSKQAQPRITKSLPLPAAKPLC
jgi:hypothetical protein